MRRQLRHREGLRLGHHRLGREVHHRHRLGAGLGQADPAAPRAAESVGIVGAGPAGLAAAEQLRRKGYQVAIYDRYDRVGGLLIYGIPNFKLEKDIVQRREKLLRDVERRRSISNCEVGRDVTLAELRAAPRRRADRDRRLQGARHRRRPASACPASCRRSTISPPPTAQGLGDAVPASTSGALDAAGKNVVVIGGGDTAMDCVRTAVRQGAQVGEVPLSPRPRQHAGLAARGEACRGGRRRVRLARRRRRPSSATARRQPRPLGAHPSRHARRHRPPDAAGDPEQPRQHRGRPGAEGAGLRSRGSAGDVRRAGSRGHRLGHAQDRLAQHDDQPRRRVRRRRHRARRLAGGVGGARRPRRRRAHPFVSDEPRRKPRCRSRRSERRC